MPLLIPAAILLAAAQVAGAPPAASPSPVPEARVPRTFGSSDIRDWYAPDNSTLIISTYGHGSFRGTFLGKCQGIRFTETLGFRTQGPNELDESTAVVLPDGRRCAFETLVPISAAEEKQARKRRGPAE